MRARHEFEVKGPFPVPLTPSRRIDDRGFVESLSSREVSVLDRRGCYVYAIRNARGYRPLYVGRTKRSFYHEAFSDRHLRRLEAFLEKSKGTLVLFFLCYVPTRGRVHLRSIEELETHLIRSAKRKNPRLLNVQTLDDPRQFTIVGVDTRGRKTDSSRALARALDLATS
jgi:hypothetical protein